jgi:hypothetical protein
MFLMSSRLKHDIKENTTEVPVIHRIGFARAIEADLEEDSAEDQLISHDEGFEDKECDGEGFDSQEYMHGRGIAFNEDELRRVTRAVQSSDGTFSKS